MRFSIWYDRRGRTTVLASDCCSPHSHFDIHTLSYPLKKMRQK